MLTEFPSPADLKGAVGGTVLYLSVYIGLLTFQSFSKFYLVAQKKAEAKKEGKRVSYKELKYYNRDDKLALLGDRSVGNFAEWALVFLPVMWMHAVFVDPYNSFTICAIYSTFRILYPLLYTKGTFVLFSTGPSYVVLLYLLYGIFTEVILV